MAGAGRAKSVARASAPGLLAVVLAACASGPAPIARPGAVDPYAPPRIVAGAAPLQCVPFARSASGIEIYGDAATWWERAAGRYPRSSHPAPGAVLVLRGYASAARGHVAVVSVMVSERVIRVDQANWLNGGEITLSVPVMDVSPNNDWTQVKVWHVPGQHWGARIYQAEGFIHPFPLVPLG
jgi:CHAP domain